ncbi:MAG: peroxiredoxin, partial [Planctomycetota bacterium]
LAWNEIGCPIAGKLAPRLARLAEEYGARGVRFVGVNSSLADERAELERESAELGRGFAVLKDVHQDLARALDVRTTTEVRVFDARGALVYGGAVDDQYLVGAARVEPASSYLVLALEAVLGGGTPPASTEAPGCLLTLAAAPALPPAPTWTKDVAAIVQRRCQPCHREGQVGPFTLTSYDDVKARAKMIASVVQDGVMPPWNADARFDGMFTNQRKLAEGEKQTLLAWLAGGLERGPGSEPASPKWPEGWSIGTPDVVLEPVWDVFAEQAIPPEGYAVPREGIVDYQYLSVETKWSEDRWIQAMEIKPGAPDVVHHVLVAIRERGGDIDEKSYLAVYVPGDTPSIYPEGYAKRLPAGATLVFQMHYTPNGKERFERSKLALVFAKEPPAFEVKTDAVVDDDFEIPAGAAAHEVRAARLLREDTGIVSLFPHMHLRGKDFKYVAKLPDGSEQELVFSHYDFAWQESYILGDPLLLPGGTTLEIVGHFDNSAANPANPDPSAKVRWGDQSHEEMFIGYFDKVVPLE